MDFQRLERLHWWLLRLLLVTLLALIAVVGLGIYQGRLTRTMVSERLGRLFAAPDTVKPYVALIAGHRGFDTGAMCADGLMEVMITEDVTDRAAQLLETAGIKVQVLDEYDSALEGLQADALVSVHVDSCVPLSGYKVASPEQSVLPEQDARLRSCLEDRYGEETGMRIHANTETSDMFGYHAFQRIADSTPAAIIEIGFLGGDRELLVDHADVAARGVAAGVVCYLNATWATPPSP
ncbi:MAG: hypothetical protein GXP37_12670 [Chloroflexi bacterium]|nr:hypothetical protein [Chloroflexota bacterium]